MPSHQLPHKPPLASTAFLKPKWTARTIFKRLGNYKVCFATKKFTGTKTKNARTYMDLFFYLSLKIMYNKLHIKTIRIQKQLTTITKIIIHHCVNKCS